MIFFPLHFPPSKHKQTMLDFNKTSHPKNRIPHPAQIPSLQSPSIPKTHRECHLSGQPPRHNHVRWHHLFLVLELIAVSPSAKHLFRNSYRLRTHRSLVLLGLINLIPRIVFLLVLMLLLLQCLILLFFFRLNLVGKNNIGFKKLLSHFGSVDLVRQVLLENVVV